MQTELHAVYVFMQRMINLDEDAWNDMKRLLQHRNYEKRAIFVEEGKLSKEIAFVIKGSFRYYKQIDGVAITTFFAFENEWVSAYANFLRQTHSYVTIEAMEATETFVLNYDDLQYLYQHHPLFERFGRLIAEYLITCNEERMYSLLLKTPLERYLKTIGDKRIYFERVPQHYLASYLGIRPESLSRIRKRLLNKPVS